MLLQSCCSNHSSLQEQMISQLTKLSVGLSSKEWGNYKRTRQGALAAFVHYIYIWLLVHTTTISNRPLCSYLYLMSYYPSTCVYHKATMLPTCALISYLLPYFIVLHHTFSSLSYMCILCVHHEELLFLDITPNPNSISRLFPILLDPKSFQTALNSSRPMSIWLPGHMPISYLSSHCRLIITTTMSLLCPNPNPRVSSIANHTITTCLVAVMYLSGYSVSYDRDTPN